MSPRKDSETLPTIFLPNQDASSPQFTVSTSPQPKNKPKIAALPPSSDLLSRLNAFLPAISAANRDLESEIATGTIASRNIENVDAKDETYIEMDLGLGVLKQIDPNNPGSSESESESDSDIGGEDADGNGEEGDVLSKLLKRPTKGAHEKPSIQEVEQENVADIPAPQGDVEMGADKK